MRYGCISISNKLFTISFFGNSEFTSKRYPELFRPSSTSGYIFIMNFLGRVKIISLLEKGPIFGNPVVSHRGIDT